MPTRVKTKRAQARAAAGEPAKIGRPVGTWTPEIVKQRIRIAKIFARVEEHALGELTKKAQMTGTQLAAAFKLMDKCVPNAVAPMDLSVSGNVTVIRRDPTKRPEGYGRKNRLPEP